MSGRTCNKRLPKISIVTPSYNQGQYIEETILSIINQNYPDLEYIIIDGGSTDDTVDIIKKYEKYITYWVSETDQGQSDAINKGIAKCTGEIFNWVNSDDLLAPDSLFAVAKHFQQDTITVLAGFRRRFVELNALFPSDLLMDRIILKENTEATLVYNHFIQLPTFFSMNVIRELKGVNIDFHYTMDSEMWQRFLLGYGQSSVKLIDVCLGYYRLHPQSKTIAKPEHFYNEAHRFYQGLYIAVELHPNAIDILTNKSEEQPDQYIIKKIDVQKVKKYAYAKLLKNYISMGAVSMFFTYFLRYLYASNSLWSGFNLLYDIFKKRLLARF